MKKRSGRARNRLPESALPGTARRRTLFLAALTAIVLAGSLLRVLAARGELWLDEIWSLRMAGLQTSPAGVFTAIHHDNNHHLNTLYLFAIPESARWIAYRVHAIAAGIGTILVAALIARRDGGRTALLAALLTAGSFLLVLYSSEARGYALAVFFALLAVPLAERYLATAHPGWAGAFGIAAVFGVLSHLTFLHAYLGLIVWTAYREFAQPARRRAMVRMVSLHLMPMLALAMLYWVDLQYMIVGGGPMISVSEVSARVLSLAAGGPEDGPLRAGVAVAVVVACIASIAAVRRSGSDLWILFLVTTIVSPVLTLIVVDSNLLYERYFLVSVTFFLLVCSLALGALARRSPLASALFVAMFLAGNGVHWWRLVQYGRGSYVAALSDISERAVQRPVTVGGDHDFRQGRLVEFYKPYMSVRNDVEYHQPFEWATAGPEWYLVHSQAAAFEPARELVIDGGRRYKLSRVYPFGGLSGWHLAVYHNHLAER